MLTLLRVIRCYVSVMVTWHKEPTNQTSPLKVRLIKRAHPTAQFSLLASCRRHQKSIAQIMLSAYLSAPGVLLAQGATAALNSAHSPAFDTSASGIPIVNINAPSAKGVSRNEYNTLNVDNKGLIFNNATDIINTQLAGYIDGNARLGGKSASIILNEVTGNSRSALNGYMEIAGQSAEMIIANQNGITCNGCGFINTTRATLTTGQALFDGDGGLSGFDVSQGDIAITGQGLNDSQTPELDILARSVQLNAKIWADQATIITGDNRINYQDKSVTARSNGEREEFALDVAAIGGMYANRIRLIGTEQGLGVNLDGEVKAVEDMILDTQGNLVHRATLSADDIQIQANELENSGDILANHINIKTTQNLSSTGEDASIQASDSILLEAQVLNNQDGAKLLSQNGDIHLIADSLINQGTIASHTLTVNTDTLNNTGENSQIFAADQLILSTSGDIYNQDDAVLTSDNALAINSQGQFFNLGGNIESLKSLSVTADRFRNTGDVEIQNDVLRVTTTNYLENQGTLIGKGITINAKELNNSTTNGKIYSTDKLDLNITGDVTNEDGALVHADTDLILDAEGNLANTDATIEAVNSIEISAENVTNSGTVLAQDGTLTIQTNKVDNQGALSANGISIKATELNNNSANAKIYSTDAIALNVQGNITNEDGALVHADSDLTFDAEGNLTNKNSTIEALNQVDIKSQNLTSSGTILAQDGTLTIQTSKVDNQGSLSGQGITINATELNNNSANAKIYSTDAITLNVQGNITNEDGALVHADSDLTLDAEGNLTNTDSTIEALSQVNIKSQTLTTSGTILAQDGSLTIDTNQVDNQGALAANGITINATELNNNSANAKIYSTDAITLNVQGNITNEDGALVHADSDLTLDAEGNLTNTDSTIEALSQVNIKSQTLTTSGTILAQDGSLTIDTNQVDNQGALAANGITINATELNNNSANAKIYSTDAITLNVQGNITNEDGALVHADSDLTLDAEGNLTNTDSTIEALNTIDINAENVTSSGTVLAQDGALTIQANKVDNQGTLAGKGITIDATELNNSSANAKIYSTDAIALNVQGNITNEDGALVHADSDLTLDAEGNLANTDATIEAVNSIEISAENVASSGTVLAQDGTLTIQTNKVDNQGSLAGKGITIDATELNNSTANAKIYSTDAIVLNVQGNIINEYGALVHADTDLTLDAEGNLTNTNSTIEALNQVDIKSQNLTSSGTILAQDGSLTIDTNQVTNQGALAGKGITINATELNNSSVNGKVYSTDKLDLNITGDVSNKDGALVHADSDLTLDAEGNLTNTDSKIEALKTIDINADNITNSGTVLAENGALTIQTNQLDNQGVLAGKGITIDATELSNSTTSGKIYSTDAIALNVQGNITNDDGALVHADSDFTLDAEGNLTNTDSTIEALNTIDINAENVTSSGTVLAQDGALIIQANKVDNQGSLSGKGITINSTELNNSTTSGKIYSKDAIALNVQGNITNDDGALIHADSDLALDAEGNLTNTNSTIEALNAIDINAENVTSSGTVLAQDGALTIQTNQLDNQGSLAGKGITINATGLNNSTVNGKVYSTDKLDLNIAGNVTNTDSALVHTDSDLTLDAEGNLTNTDATIEALNQVDIKSQSLTSSGAILAQDGSLTIDTNQVTNQGALAGKGIKINATELNNSSVNGKVYSTDKLDLNITGDITNKDGALLHASTALTVDSGDDTSSGKLTNTNAAIEALNTIDINAENVASSGTVLAQDGALTIQTNKMDNQGTLAGKGITIDATELNNSTANGKIYSIDAIALNVQGNITNEDGALVHADSDLTLDAEGNLTNTNSTVEALNQVDLKSQNLTSSGTILAQDGTLTIQTNKVDNQGTLAGKGITINANKLNNSTVNGKVYSTDKLDLNITGDVTNEDGALVHADSDLTLDADGNLTNTSSTIEALNTIDINTANVTSSGTILAQDGTLTIQTNQLDNQGALAGKGITINATELSNSSAKAKIYSTDAIALNVQGNITNEDGALVHADSDLTLDAEGNLTNTDSTIEALNTININTDNVASSGTVFAQDGTLTIQTNKVDNQGSLAGKGITIDATELNNKSANAKMYSTDAIALNVQGNITNEDGALVHADTDLTLDAEGNLANTDATIEAVNSIEISAENVASSGTVLAQDGTLTIQTNKVDNQGSLAGKGITINATELNNSTVNGKVYSTDKLDLNITGDVLNKDGALLHANTELTMDSGDDTSSGKLTNTDSTIEALNQVDIKSQNLTNSGMILAQDGSLTIDTNQVTNQGALAGKGIIINATELSNSTVNGKVYSTDKLDLNITGDVTNKDGALLHANTELTMDSGDDTSSGKLTNTDSTIEALNQVDIKSQNLTNS
ncbi:two-partner secretion domain-containing protein, partial [Marinomonas sp. TW1]|uniref:two-partner secretion domain-containing protein n=1 Tax=Marinomonas sp. TW1 TaxID=1561203 RepID=UPI0007B319AE